METMETNDRTQLLEEILAHQKKELRHARIVSAVCLILIAALMLTMAVILPRTVRLIDELENSLQGIDTLVENSRTSLDKINTFVSQANDLLADNTQELSDAIEKISSVDYPLLGDTLRETAEKLQSIDFGTLNKAIQELETIVKPLADLIGRFTS